MSHSRKPSQDAAFDSVTTRFRDSFTCSEDTNKPDFRELDLGSPVSPLTTRRSINNSNHVPSNSSSSASSSGSISGKPTGTTQLTKRLENGAKSYSAESSGLSEISQPPANGSAPTIRNAKPGHRRSVSAGPPLIYSGSSFTAIGNVTHGNGATSASSNPIPNVLPSGNICPSGKILKTGMTARVPNRTDTLCTGTGNYGHGNIVRGFGKMGGAGNAVEGNMQKVTGTADAEEVKRAGNEMYRKGNFVEALAFYDRAISMSPENAAYRSNRAATLTSLGRIAEAVRECEEAVRLDPAYTRANQRLVSLYLRLGQAENMRHHLCSPGHHPNPAELQKLQELEKHLTRYADARKIGDWKNAIREADAAIAIGADFSPQLVACKAEAFLKLHQIEDADSCLSNIPKLESYPPSQIKFFGMVTEAYVLYVQAQVEMALGRFENAVSKAEKAGLIDHSNLEVATLLNNVKMVAKARFRGNDLFSSGRYSEACLAYGEGVRYDSSNSVLYCNRAVCWSKLGLWEKSVEDCNQALKIQPNYTKALLRRAVSNGKLGRWVEAVRDYEVLRKELPGDKEVAESFRRAQAALNISHEEEVLNIESSSEVEDVSSMDRFKAVISMDGVSVIYFKAASNEQCEEISPFINMLCVRYPSVHFFKVDLEESLAVARAESIRTVPTFKIYKNGQKVKEMVHPTHQLLEDSVRSCSV